VSLRQFKVVHGKHAIRQANGKLQIFKTGQVVASTDNLVEKHGEKFVEVFAGPSPTETALERAIRARRELEEATAEIEREKKEKEEELEARVDEEVSDEDLPPEPEEKPDYGTDVSKKFSSLAAEGLRVFYDGDNYVVMQDDEVIGGPMEGKTDVVDWFKKWKKKK